jgi:hypothetical protein
MSATHEPRHRAATAEAASPDRAPGHTPTGLVLTDLIMGEIQRRNNEISRQPEPRRLSPGDRYDARLVLDCLKLRRHGQRITVARAVEILDGPDGPMSRLGLPPAGTYYMAGVLGRLVGVGRLRLLRPPDGVHTLEYVARSRREARAELAAKLRADTEADWARLVAEYTSNVLWCAHMARDVMIEALRKDGLAGAARVLQPGYIGPPDVQRDVIAASALLRAIERLLRARGLLRAPEFGNAGRRRPFYLLPRGRR